MKKKSFKKLALQKKAIATLDTAIGGNILIDQTGFPGSICEPVSLCNTQCVTMCELTVCYPTCRKTENNEECTVVSPLTMHC